MTRTVLETKSPDNYVFGLVSGTAGSIIYATGDGSTTTALSPGSAGSYLTISAGVPDWTTTLASANLDHNTITIGSTSIALGATSTTLAGLTSVTSTTFIGALTGNASTATLAATAVNLQDTGGAAGDLPYQTGPGATAFLPIGAANYVLSVASGLPSWISQTSLNVGSADNATDVLTSLTSGANTYLVMLSASSTTGYQSPLMVSGLSFNNTTGTLVAPTFSGSGAGLTSIPNSALSNSSITVTGGTGLGVSGSPVSLGGTLTLSNTGVTSIIAGTAISVNVATGAVTVNNTGVTSFVTTLSGLTPSSSTTGGVTLAGTLNSTSGGTGTSTAPTSGQILVGTSGGQYTPATLGSGAGISTTAGSGTLQINNTGVTSLAGTASEITASASTGAVTVSLPAAITTPGTLTIGMFLYDSFAGISAAGTTQGTATAIADDINNVTTVAAGAGVRLPTAVVGSEITVLNNGANALLIYPATGALIDGGTSNAAISLAVGSSWTGTAISTTAWETTVAPIVASTGVSAVYSAGNVTITNTGVTSLAGTTSQIAVSASTGAVTLSLPASVAISNLTLGGITAKSFLYSGTNGLLTTTAAPSNGQLLIGSTGVDPVLGSISASGAGITVTPGAGTIALANTGVTSITGTTNQVNATASTGAITLSLPQNINTTATPTFNQVTITNSPVAGTDTVNLSYLQSFQSGLEWKDAAAAATTANLTATYNNGASGVGATLTNSGTQVAFAVDGYTANLNDRILVKNQTTTFQNGIYTVTNTGSGSTNWILARAGDANTPSGLDNATLLVLNGTANANTGWTQTTSITTIGTTAVTFSQFSGSSTYSAGTGLTLTSNTFSITNTGVTATSYGSASSVATFTVNAQGQLTTAATTPIAIAGTQITSGTVAINVGGTGLTTNPTSGQLLIGNSGSGYSLSTLTGTANQITVTNGSGSITLSVPSAFITPGSAQITTYLYLSTSTGLTATGSTLATALALTSQYNVVSTVAAGTGVSLPAPSFGGEIVTIVNQGANSLNVYPPNTSSKIDGAAVGVAVVLPSGATAEYSSSSTTQWYTVNPPDVAGTGISVTYGNGSVTIANTGVTSFQTSLSGLTPSSGTTGAITLAGTLGATSGGTGSSSAPTSGQLLYSSGGTTYAPTTLTTLAVTSLTGTANEIAVSASTGAVTLSMPSNVIIPTPASGDALSVTGSSTGQPISITTGATQQGVEISGAATTSKGVLLETASVLRWFVASNQTAESGSNVGSDFGIFAYSDAGANLGNPIAITRSTGGVTIAAPYGAQTALKVTAAANSAAFVATQAASSTAYTAIIQGSTTSGNSLGLAITAGTTSADAGLLVKDATNTNAYLTVFGNGQVNLGYNGSGTTMSLGATGQATIASLAAIGLDLNGAMNGGATVYSIRNIPTFGSAVTTSALVFSSAPSTAAASFTLPNLYHYRVDDVTVGAGSTVTAQTGFFVSTLTGGSTNNYGFRGNIAAATGAYNIYMSGTADNYLAGNLLLGSSTDSGNGQILQVTGSASISSTLTMSGGLLFDTAVVAAAGTSQGTATALTADTNFVTSGTGGVELPATGIGREITIINRAGVTINVYPASGASIDGSSANIATPVPANGWLTVIIESATQYYTIDPVTVAGAGISVTQSNNGEITIANTGVTSFQTSLSGLSPSASTTGAVTLSGTLNATSGGTGTSTAPTSGQVLVGTSGGEYVPATIASGTGISTTTGSGTLQINNTGVTSIAGTANQITASASTGAVTLSLPASVTITTGLTISGLTANSFVYSGTAGLLTSTTAPTNGQLLIGNTGAAPVAATVASGTGISTTVGAGTLQINNTGVTSNVAGTGISVSGATGAVTISNTGVTSFTAGTTGLTPSSATTGAITLAGTLNIANGGTGQGSASGAFGALSPLTTNGDLLVYNSGNTRLSVGASNKILTVSSGAPAWVYPTIAVNALSAVTTYTLALTDQGGQCYITDASFTTLTVPANGSVAFPVGSAVTIINQSGASISIAITTDTMYLAGTGTTGTRTLANFGVATVNKVATTTWFASGVGLT